MKCALTIEQHGTLLSKVDKDLQDFLDKKLPFDIKEYIKSVHDLVLDKTKDSELAVAYAQLVPSVIERITPFNSEVKKLIKSTLGLDRLDDLIGRFKDIQEIPEYIGKADTPIKTIKEDIKEKADLVNKAPVSVQSQPLNITVDKFPAKPVHPLSTTTQSAKGNTKEEIEQNIQDERVIPYENFQKSVVMDLMKSGIVSSEMKVEGLKGGIYLTAVLGSAIPETHLHPRTKERLSSGKLTKEVHDKTATFVITDKNGKFLYFSDENKITTPDKGRLMLYNMRSDRSSLQSVEEVADKLKITDKQAAVYIKDGFDTADKVRKYLQDNPKAKVRSIIDGGTRGYVPQNRTAPIKLSDIKGDNIKTKIAIEPNNKISTIFMHVPGIDTPFQISETNIESEDASKIADFITSKVYQKGPGNKDVLVTNDQKHDYLRPILFSNHIHDIQRLPDKQSIIDRLTKPYAGDAIITKDKAESKGRIWKLDDSDVDTAKSGSPVEISKNGKPEYHWLQRIHWNISKDFEDREFNQFDLTPREDGGHDLKATTSDYNTWTKEHTTTLAQTNANNEIVAMNPYFTYKFHPDDLAKISNKTEAITTGVKEAEKTKVPDANSPTSYKKVDLKNTVDRLKQEGLLKNFYQKAENVKATEDQIERAQKWWKDSPLSKHLTFTEAFNMVNTVHPDTIAQWTTYGITLYKGADFTDLYHEAWHGFTQMFLTKDEKLKMYTELAKKSGSFTDYAGRSVSFKYASEKQLEEYLAEEFRKYMLKPEHPVESPIKNSMFRKIVNFLKSLFEGLTVHQVVTNDNSTAHIHELFEKLRVGNVNEFTYEMNNRNFDVLNKGITKLQDTKEQDDSLGHTDSKLIDDTINHLITDSVNQLNAGIDSDENWNKIKSEYNHVFPDLESGEFSAFREANDISSPSKRDFLTEGSLMKNEDTRQILYTNVLYKLAGPDGVRERLKSKINLLPDGPEKQRLTAKLKALDFSIRNFGKPEVSGDLLKDNGAISYNLRKSPFLSHLDKSKIYEELAEDEKDTGYDKRGNKSPLEDMFDPKISSFLKGLYDVDKSGKAILNELDVPKPADFKVTVNRLSKVLGNGIDKDQMYEILAKNQSHEPIFTQILNKLGPNYTSNDKAANLQILLRRAFNLAKVDLVQLTQGMIDAEIRTTFGQASSPTDTIDRDWNTRFALTESNTIKKDAQGTSYLDLDAVFKEHPIFTIGKEHEFLNSIGMVMSDDANGNIRKILSDKGAGGGKIKYIYNTLQKVHELQNPSYYGIDKKPISIRITSIRDIEKGFQKYVDSKSTDPKLYKQLAGLQGRYNWILDLEAKYNDRVGHTVTNAKGDAQQDLTVPTFQTDITNAINRAKDWNDLVSMPGMDYLARNRNFLARYSRILNSIFDMKTGKKREKDHVPYNLKLENFAGIALTEDNQPLGGSAITDLDKLSSFLSYRDGFVLGGKSGGPNHGDKNTTFIYSTKTIAKDPNTKHSGQYYVDINHFIRDKSTKDSKGRDLSNEILIDYINGELNRIHIYNSLPDNASEKFAFPKGGEFAFFHDVLSKETKKQLLDIQEIKDNVDYTLQEYLMSEKSGNLHENITKDLDNYFNHKIEEVQGIFDKVAFEDPTQINKVMGDKTFNTEYKYKDRVPTAITEAFVYNSWMHTFEGRAIYYGDIAQFRKPEDASKRDGIVGSPRVTPDTSKSTLAYINGKGDNMTPYAKSSHYPKNKEYKTPAFTDTTHTAVLQDPIQESEHLSDIREAMEEDLRDRIKLIKESGLSEEDIKDQIDATVKGYKDMKVADSAGVITWDYYRLLRMSLGSWNPILEKAFMSIVNKEPVSFEEAALFGPIKMMHEGPLVTKGLPIMANHKFMLVPLNPNMIKGKKLEVLHNKMVEQNISYAVFQSGSKTGTITKDGKADAFYTDMKTKGMAFDKSDYKFTKNTIYLKNLGEQIPVSDEFDGKTTTSRQLRTLIIADKMSGGVPIDFQKGGDHDKNRESWNKLSESEKLNQSPTYRVIKDYQKNLSDKTEKIKNQIKRELGWTDKEAHSNIKKLLEFARGQMERKNLPEHLIDYIEYNPSSKTSLKQLSLSLNAEEMESEVVNSISKRLTNQKSNGQSYKLVSDIGHESVYKSNKVPHTEADIAKMIERKEIEEICPPGSKKFSIKK